MTANNDNGLSLFEVLESLSPEIIVERARQIEVVRAAGPNLSTFHGFEEPLLHATPFEWLAAVIARARGTIAFDRLDRVFLPTPPSWVDPTFGPAYYQVHHRSERVLAPPLWPFGHDLPVADHTSTSQTRWFTHGLIHTMIGASHGGLRTEWEIMAEARLSEAVAALHWYHLAELGRLGAQDVPLDLTDLRGEDAVRYARLAQRSLEPDFRLRRLEDPLALPIASNAIDMLRYEAWAFRAAMVAGELKEPDETYLGLGEACEYARVHARRLNCSSHARWRDTCLVPGADFAPDWLAFETRVASVVHDLFLRPLETFLEIDDATAHQRRFRTVLADVGLRLCHAEMLESQPSSRFEGVLAAIGEHRRSAKPVEAAKVWCDIVEATDGANAGGQVPTDSLLALGYAPVPGQAEAPLSRGARVKARLARAWRWHAVMGSTLTAMPPVVERSLDLPMSRWWLENLVQASETLARDGAVTWEGWGYLGWLTVAASLWRDGQAIDPSRRWHDRLARRTLPDDPATWHRFEILWNPYLQRVPMPFDARWDEEQRLVPGASPPQRFKPRAAHAIWYCLIGQGRDGPVYLPLTTRLNALVQRLKRPARLDAVARAPDFGPDFLRAAVASEAVLLVERPPFDLPERPLDVLEIAMAAAGSVDQRREDEGPWQDEAQAEAYVWFCNRSSLYRDTSEALCDAADIPSDGRIGELGFGTGETTRAILRRLSDAGRVVGVDPALRMVSSIFDHVSDHRARFLPGASRALLHLAVTDRPFDRVIANSSLTLARSIADECAHVFAMLRPGGLFAFSIPAEYLGMVDHMTTPEMIRASTAIAEARAELGLKPPPATPSVDPALGSLDAMNAMLERCGFATIRHVVYKRPWPAAEYFDWLSMPVVRKGMVSSGDADRSGDLIEAARARIEPELRLETAWCLIVATRPDSGASNP
jgi:SAM-dependent methyltransferase